METVVQKFGGTSVADLARIGQIALRIAAEHGKNRRIVAVVSAMAGETDRLIALAQQGGNRPNPREVDALLATGEEVTAALLANTLNAIGVSSESFTGGQVPIRTTREFGEARIQFVSPHNIRRALDEGKVVVVAGFQGVTADGEVTTLGRGGSDLTAVALAAALEADRCELYKEVPGILTADPTLCPDARLVRELSYDEMLELASLGARVLQMRSVQLAKRYQVPLHVRSAFEDRPGTWVKGERPNMEGTVVSAITCDRKEAKISLRRLGDPLHSLPLLFERLAQAKIIVDVIVQDRTVEGHAHVAFTVPRDSSATALEIARDVARQSGDADVTCDEKIAKVSVVGLGMRYHSGVASKMLRAISKEGIEVLAISTSDIKISCVVEDRYAELIVRSLHETFGLAKEPN